MHWTRWGRGNACCCSLSDSHSPQRCMPTRSFFNRLIALLAVICQRHSSTRCAAPAASPPHSALRSPPPPVVSTSASIQLCFPPAAAVPSPHTANALPPPPPRAKNAVTGVWPGAAQPFQTRPLHTAELGTGCWFKMIGCTTTTVERHFFKKL